MKPPWQITRTKATFAWTCPCGRQVRNGEVHECTWVGGLVMAVPSPPEHLLAAKRPNLRLIQGGKK